jgi:ubiquinone/menaquinone biosynthesis C-methylase UbiE
MNEAEFDTFADEYYDQHRKNIRLSGETPEFFSEYKIRETRAAALVLGRGVDDILDFGSGIGNSLPAFRTHFPHAQLTCADPSARSMSIAQQRYPGTEAYCHIQGREIPCPGDSFDLAFAACVFHHIDHGEHVHWLKELRRVVRASGLLVIFEHNPFNPLTVHAVNTCPFDANAKLITARSLSQAITSAGWAEPRISYRLFFPHVLGGLRPLERHLGRIPLGAQYFVVARKP